MHVMMNQGLRMRGRDLIQLLGNASDMYSRYMFGQLYNRTIVICDCRFNASIYSRW
jgi:hypothetical protein